jgi:hypothetical protein
LVPHAALVLARRGGAMRIAAAGGHGGLHFAALARQLDPRHEITVGNSALRELAAAHQPATR